VVSFKLDGKGSGDMILDHDRVREITRGNSKLLVSISQQFLNDLPDMISDVEKAYQQADHKALLSAVHRLKSALGNFASCSYYQEFSRLEKSATENKSPVVQLADWSTDWNAAKLKLDTMIVELTEMAGI
jgi:HPt (histidine-containing phosphotransfer) domain-containing protein